MKAIQNRLIQKTRAICFLTYILLFMNLSHAYDEEETPLQTYIVHLEKPETRAIQTTQSYDTISWYHSFLHDTISSSSSLQQKRLIYPYKNAITGFAARLTENEAKSMESKKGVILIRRENTLSLHTTHSPNFLGLYQGMGFWKDSNFGKGMIIGILDTGIDPNHPSFNDENIPPPPPKWKGKCEFLTPLSCNNKIIGARTFQGTNNKVKPPIDEIGHGTHTSSIAAGNFVKGANVLGNAYGTASGLAPLAHLAIYKTCSKEGCPESDVLAALDAAIEDGVDILSISLGSSPTNSFLHDVVALGTFKAMEKGIFVSSSAGNLGPFKGSVENTAPWVLTVGSSTTDRTIKATARLGNGQDLEGESLNQLINFTSNLRPLINPTTCNFETVKTLDVQGKIILCQGSGDFGTQTGVEVKKAGGAGLILYNIELDGFSIPEQYHVIPATFVSYADGLKIKSYINSTPNPLATILFQGTHIGKPSSPMVSATSSRGPNLVSPEILKPDIIAPGLNILAAWPFSLEINNNTNTNSSKEFNFNIISGTSMACPHLSGIAALLKSSHPDWSPSEIKSAMMTSSDVVNLEGKPIIDQLHEPASVFEMGAGEVNPSRANDPGLLYGISSSDYRAYLCGMNLTDQEIGLIVHRRVRCYGGGRIEAADLNYPAIGVELRVHESKTVKRSVVNVGREGESYRVEVLGMEGVEVDVTPKEMVFREAREKINYTLSFKRLNVGVDNEEGGGGPSGPTFVYGYLRWVSDWHSVRSPIAVIFK